MSFLLFGFLLLHICNGVSSKQYKLEDAVKNDPTKIMFKNENGIGDKFEELMQRVERMDISWKLEKADLEKKLETKNVEVENQQQQLKEMKVQFAEIESRMAVSVKSEVKVEVKKELDKVLPTAVEQGLRDLPFEMVCAHQYAWQASNSVINYDRISMEFNNSNRPGGLFVQIY